MIIDAETNPRVISWTNQLKKLWELTRQRIKESPKDKEEALQEFTKQEAELEAGLLTEIQFFILSNIESEAIMHSFRELYQKWKSELE